MTNRLKIRLIKKEYDPPRVTGGLAKTHKIIRTERIKELQFLKLCEQIQLNEDKQKRSESQRNGRVLKRKNTRINNEINEEII